MNLDYVLVGGFVAINSVAFLFMLIDKKKAAHGNDDSRIPEGLLFCIGTMFGSVGVYAGMQVLRHKTRKWYFSLGMPLLIIQNIATIYLAREFFMGI